MKKVNLRACRRTTLSYVSLPLFFYSLDLSWQFLFSSDYDLDVTNHYLSRMEYVENGTKKEVRIYDESAHMWPQIGENLGIEGGVLTSIKRDGHDNRERVVKVLGKWYENANGLPHADEYPMTWKGLINLLKNSDLNRLAEKVRKALTPHKRSGKY